jgi:hypothetical protein
MIEEYDCRFCKESVAKLTSDKENQKAKETGTKVRDLGEMDWEEISPCVCGAVPKNIQCSACTWKRAWVRNSVAVCNSCGAYMMNKCS